MLDHDNVLSLWVHKFYPWICDLEGWTPRDGYGWMGWHFYRDHGMTDEAFLKRLNEYAEAGGFADQEPNVGLLPALERIKRAGFTIHVVTDRPKIAEADTAWWLHTYAGGDDLIDTLTISRDKTVFKEFGPPPYFALDDRIENVQAMLDADIDAYLLTWPWNEQSDLERVSSLHEFAELVVDATEDK